jgi:hypothetical protein
MSEDLKLQNLISDLKILFTHLSSKWRSILAFLILGAFLGLGISYLKGIKYISRLTFVLEDSKSSGAGLAALAGQFGFDLGSLSGNGFFSGENIILYLTSENLCRKTLMTSYDDKGKLLLVDKYAEVSGLRSKWERDSSTRGVLFSRYKNSNLPRREDSLLQIIIKKILTSDFLVSKPEKKASFIEVIAKMKDEKLSQLFTKQLVEIATNRYIELKTKVKYDNVVLLQKRADSLAFLLNDKTYLAASSQQKLVDINPALRTIPIMTEIATRDKAMVGAIFSEVVKNLEISKTLLYQSTPIVQIVDLSSFPLKKDEFKVLPSIIVGGLALSFLYSAFLITLFLIKSPNLKV